MPAFPIQSTNRNNGSGVENENDPIFKAAEPYLVKKTDLIPINNELAQQKQAILDEASVRIQAIADEATARIQAISDHNGDNTAHSDIRADLNTHKNNNNIHADTPAKQAALNSGIIDTDVEWLRGLPKLIVVTGTINLGSIGRGFVDIPGFIGFAVCSLINFNCIGNDDGTNPNSGQYPFLLWSVSGQRLSVERYNPATTFINIRYWALVKEDY